MKLRFCPLAAIMFAALASSLAAASPGPQGSGNCNLIEVWVDPVRGVDPSSTQPPTHQVSPINNPSGPTKTIQAAIDIAFKHLVLHYHPLSNPDQEALVHLMPGIYGPGTIPSGGVGNGELFPISMRDRVHVRGVNARRCVIRGADWQQDDQAWFDHLTTVFWPIAGTCNFVDPNFPTLDAGFRKKQVLVDYTWSGARPHPSLGIEFVPWEPGTAELLEAVTLQGGDVQVLFGFDPEEPMFLHGTVANCLFDMRSGLPTENGQQLGGPSMGLMVQTSWIDDLHLPPDATGITGEGYISQEVHVVGNTFLMAERLYNGTQNSWLQAAPGAAAVLDTGYPICGGGDTDNQKGVNRLGLQNNLFRTHTGGAAKDDDRMAMVGVSSDDAMLDLGALSVDTNSYCIDRSGDATEAPQDFEHTFESPAVALSPSGSVTLGTGEVVTLWNGSPPTPPASVAPTTPAVALWDGNGGLGTQYDPLFVGEYLRTISPALPSYRDFRLLPGSPMQNMGRWTGTSIFDNGDVFDENECETLRVSTWDHEAYGNPRIVDSHPDIGFDEVHLGVMAGSYANHSYSHNRSGSLNSQVVDEQDTRFLFLRENEPGTLVPLAGRTLELISNEIVPSGNYRAWTNPPGSSSPGPIQQGSSVAGYDLRYTVVTAQNQVPWMDTYQSLVPAGSPTPQWILGPGQAGPLITLVPLPADDEGAGFTSWVNIQALVSTTDDSVNLWGSMQVEYR